MSKGGDIAFGLIRPGKALEAQAKKEQAKKDLANAQQMRQQGMDLAGKLNWEPNYVSSMIGPYQKTVSPIARSFLESLLTGASPSNVQGTRLGADRQKAAAQSNFDQQFGGWDALQARQQAAEQATPWAVKPPQAPAVRMLPDFRRNVTAAAAPTGQAIGQMFGHDPLVNTGGLGGSVQQELDRRQAAGLTPQGLPYSDGLYGGAVDAELARRRAAAGQSKAPGWGATGRQS